MRWRELREGDVLVYALVAERRFKKRWSEEHSNTVYWRKGLLLDLLKGTARWEDLDDCTLHGEIIKGSFS